MVRPHVPPLMNSAARRPTAFISRVLFHGIPTCIFRVRDTHHQKSYEEVPTVRRGKYPHGFCWELPRRTRDSIVFLRQQQKSTRLSGLTGKSFTREEKRTLSLSAASLPRVPVCMSFTLDRYEDQKKQQKGDRLGRLHREKSADEEETFPSAAPLDSADTGNGSSSDGGNEPQRESTSSFRPSAGNRERDGDGLAAAIRVRVLIIRREEMPARSVSWRITEVPPLLFFLLLVPFCPVRGTDPHVEEKARARGGLQAWPTENWMLYREQTSSSYFNGF